jgi:signal transduction histidine kinase/ActR/RegA family two-component response regulator
MEPEGFRQRECMGLFGWMKSLFGPDTREPSLTGETGEGYVSKELFYKILDLESSIVLFFTEAGGWIGANRAFSEIFPFEDITRLRQEHESVRELFEEESEEIFTEYDKSWLDYLRVHKRDGYGVKIRDKEGVLRSFLAKSRLIKERGRTLYILELEDHTELEEVRSRSEEIERLKSKFLANIGHEFRTPMNGILGFIDLLEKSRPTEQQGEYLHMIHASARSLMTNIESLIDLAQMQSGRLKRSDSEFSPVTEMEELAHIYTVSARDRQIALNFFIDPKLPRFLEGDLRKVKQTINNLVHNALKFTRAGGHVNVEVKLVRRLGAGRCSVGFSVRDTGKGIPREQLAVITQPFVAGEQADERLGVGLSLSHGLVQLLGGKLNIQSEEGKGSSFSFVLEFNASKEQAMPLVEGKTAKVVLLHETRINDANFLTHYLRSFGLNVIKMHMIDDTVYDNAQMLYLVGMQEEADWSEQLAAYPKGCPVTFLLGPEERLDAAASHVVDHTLCTPLLPTQIAHHLAGVGWLPRTADAMQRIQQEHIRALVAEDNLINQRLIRIMLQEYNISVRTTSNGTEAVKACGEEDFDIVFMDIDMPIKDGILATQEIKEQRNPGRAKYTPIVALTALAMEGDREHILEEGLDDYLSKPLTREKLEHILNKHLKLSL